jgi:hypothetical protein
VRNPGWHGIAWQSLSLALGRDERLDRLVELLCEKFY